MLEIGPACWTWPRIPFASITDCPERNPVLGSLVEDQPAGRGIDIHPEHARHQHPVLDAGGRLEELSQAPILSFQLLEALDPGAEHKKLVAERFAFPE